jgi:hypothetical protein
MIALLASIFLTISVYGVVVGHFGGALISLGMAVFVIWGARQLDKRDAEFYASPASAKTIPDTLEAMAKQEVESSSSRF